MKVVVKKITPGQNVFEIEMEATSTVRDVKHRLNEQYAIGAPELLKLIFGGKILVDDETLNGTVDYSEDQFMVVMVSKAKAPAAASPSASSAVPDPAPAPARPAPSAPAMRIFITNQVQRHTVTIDVAEDASVCHVTHAFCDKFNANVKPGTAMLPCQVRAAGSYHLDHE